jgi:hypothetical protein
MQDVRIPGTPHPAAQESHHMTMSSPRPQRPADPDRTVARAMPTRRIQVDPDDGRGLVVWLLAALVFDVLIAALILAAAL